MKILIAIHGAHCEPERRQGQRETWLADLQGADYRYFLGRPAGSDADTEYLDTPDGPLWEGSRRTLVLNRKTEALCRYAIEGGYDYVFKCDDDTYVDVSVLLASGFEEYDYVGSMDRHHASPGGWYSWAQGGAGYWLSRTAMQIVAANGLHLARAEDFAVGQLLASHGIAAHHDARYIPALDDLDHLKSDAITFHKVSPNWMRAIHKLKGASNVRNQYDH